MGTPRFICPLVLQDEVAFIAKFARSARRPSSLGDSWLFGHDSWPMSRQETRTRTTVFRVFLTTHLLEKRDVRVRSRTAAVWLKR